MDCGREGKGGGALEKKVSRKISYGNFRPKVRGRRAQKVHIYVEEKNPARSKRQIWPTWPIFGAKSEQVSSPIMGHNWKHTRTCFLLKIIFK